MFLSQEDSCSPKILPVVRLVLSFSCNFGCWCWQIFYRHLSQIKACLVLKLDLQSQEGIRSLGLYSSKYGIWSVIWLKCTENGQWLNVISDSDGGTCICDLP